MDLLAYLAYVLDAYLIEALQFRFAGWGSWGV
jgi:hypothetical protein